MNRDEVIDVLTAVAACDRRTVGESDVTVWLSIIGDLPKNLALQAVLEHFKYRPGVWLEPGHVRAGVAEIRREQYARRTDEEQAAIEAMIDSKVADMIAELAEAKTIPSGDFERPAHNPLLVPCSWCRVIEGERCVIPGSSQRLSRFHPSRVAAVKAGAM